MRPLRYWLRLGRLFYHYRRRSVRLPYKPIRLWVELASSCNYRCVMCPNKDLGDEDKGLMAMGVFRKIVDEAAGFASDINLAHRGESLLHPEAASMIALAKERKLYTRLHTNGSLLTEDKARAIIRSGLDRLSFSFDGFDKETYESIRRGGDFEQTVRNIVRFLEIKKESGSKKPQTAIEVISFERIVRHAEKKEEFLSQFRGLPLDSLVMKDMHNWAGQLRDKKKGRKYSVCPFPWNALIVFWDGSVLPCTQDFFGGLKLGQVEDASLEEIWNGPRMVELRAKLAAGEIKGLGPCSGCDRPWRADFLGVPREYLWKFITRRMP